jgi:hypothetical protein
MVKYLNSHRFSFALIYFFFNVNGKATVWDDPLFVYCFFPFQPQRQTQPDKPMPPSRQAHWQRGPSGVSPAQHRVIGPRTFSWSKGLRKGLYQWALTPGLSVACLNFELAKSTEPTYIRPHKVHTFQQRTWKMVTNSFRIKIWCSQGEGWT